MHSPKRLALLGLAAFIAGSLGLKAQDADSKLSLDWKMRLGYAPSSKDNLRQSFLGFGMGLGYDIGPGKVVAELGYFYKTGDNYTTMPNTSSIKTGLVQTLDTTNSIEDRRNELEGFTVRLSYHQALTKSWAWQGGLQFGTHFKQQYIGDCRSTNYTSYTNSDNQVVMPDANSWRDLYNGTPTKAYWTPSPFAGVTLNLDKDSALEFNVLLLSYNALEYKHYAGTASNYHGGVHQVTDTGSASGPYVGPVSDDEFGQSTFPNDSVQKTSRIVPHFEITYVFHF